jgi:hypothetical protein
MCSNVRKITGRGAALPSGQCPWFPETQFCITRGAPDYCTFWGTVVDGNSHAAFPRHPGLLTETDGNPGRYRKPRSDKLYQMTHLESILAEICDRGAEETSLMLARRNWQGGPNGQLQKTKAAPSFSTRGGIVGQVWPTSFLSMLPGFPSSARWHGTNLEVVEFAKHFPWRQRRQWAKWTD